MRKPVLLLTSCGAALVLAGVALLGWAAGVSGLHSVIITKTLTVDGVNLPAISFSSTAADRNNLQEVVLSSGTAGTPGSTQSLTALGNTVLANMNSLYVYAANADCTLVFTMSNSAGATTGTYTVRTTAGTPFEWDLATSGGTATNPLLVGAGALTISGSTVPTAMNMGTAGAVYSISSGSWSGGTSSTANGNLIVDVELSQ